MNQTTSAAPIALQQGEGDARWFLGGLCTIKSTGEQTGGRVAVTENWAPRGHGSPLHVHHQEDEWFYVLSGELTFWVDGRVITATEGSFVYGPRDVPHTFNVTSDEARFLLVVEPAGLEDFIRALRTRPVTHAAPNLGSTTRNGDDAGNGGRARHRDPRTSRHSHLTQDTITCSSRHTGRFRSSRRGRS